jgi:hypothetical protein
MDLTPVRLLLEAMLAPHTLARSHAHAQPLLEESAEGWLISCALPGMAAKDVSVETSAGADGDAHLWLNAPPRCQTEFRCVRRNARRTTARAPRARAAPRCARCRANARCNAGGVR